MILGLGDPSCLYPVVTIGGMWSQRRVVLNNALRCHWPKLYPVAYSSLVVTVDSQQYVC